jgi:thiamine biosynthesis lipoprotein
MDSSFRDQVRRYLHEAMGTLFEVMIAGLDEDDSREASRAVFQEVDRLEGLFSRFNASSEISQINRLAPGGVRRIGWETYECLSAAERLRHETAGAFNVNFRAERIRPSSETRPEAEPAAASISAYEVFPVPDGFAIRINQRLFEDHGRGVDLDLGAIGKGFALDRAAAVLADWSVDNFLMHAGTSTALAGGSAPAPAPGSVETGWPVGAGGTWDLPGQDKRLLLRNRALSGSGTEVKGRHIKDPGTGEAAVAHLAAWVSHPRAAVADALSTAFMVMRTEEVDQYCREHADVWALVITPDGRGHVFNPGLLTA